MVTWDLAEVFGWTLEYIDNLSIQKTQEYYQIKDARHKARK
jgi:hypothetical protein